MAGEKFVGNVKWFNSTKGFGFIELGNGSKDAFVHFSEIKGTSKSLNTGDKVRFETKTGTKGISAINVELIS